MGVWPWVVAGLRKQRCGSGFAAAGAEGRQRAQRCIIKACVVLAKRLGMADVGGAFRKHVLGASVDASVRESVRVSIDVSD